MEEIRSKNLKEKIKVNFVIPDFTYQEWISFSRVKPDRQPLAGLQAEDVITKINDADIEDLRFRRNPPRFKYWRQDFHNISPQRRKV